MENIGCNDNESMLDCRSQSGTTISPSRLSERKTGSIHQAKGCLSCGLITLIMLGDSLSTFLCLALFSIGNGTTLGGSRGLLDPPGNLASNNKDKRSSGMVPPVWSFLELISVLDYAPVWLKPFCPAP